MYEIIDLHFQGEPEIIASYALRGPRGVALIETGPGSTVENLLTGLMRAGIAKEEITDILLTHIHLDHAGAAGYMARLTGATVHVHHVGAPHMIDPSKLLASAGRIYGDQMGPLWGEFLSVPAEQVHALEDGDIIDAAGIPIKAVDTPGHAYHHMAYWLNDAICFTGDIAAVRLPGFRHIRLPTPPPEFHLQLWKESVAKLKAMKPDLILPTHFGHYDDVDAHFDGVIEKLDALTNHLRKQVQAGLTAEEMMAELPKWLAQQARREGVRPDGVHRYEVVVPSYMNVTGVLRYFRKVEGMDVSY